VRRPLRKRAHMTIRATPPKTRRSKPDAAPEPASPSGLPPPTRFVEVEGIHPEGSSQDLRLRFTRRVIFLARRWRNQINDGLREIGQSHARWITLTWVSILAGKANLGELADRIGVELPTLIRLLNRLEEEGLVERSSLTGSGRAKAVTITPAGEAVLDELNRITRKVRSNFLKSIDDADLAKCIDVFDALLDEDES
jgi:MarR family transcriptional regulator, transcriptional regulator for hemolysin